MRYFTVGTVVSRNGEDVLSGIVTSGENEADVTEKILRIFKGVKRVYRVDEITKEQFDKFAEGSEV